ncbi:unnamed protein product, partial [Symbiodinium natans]
MKNCSTPGSRGKLGTESENKDCLTIDEDDDYAQLRTCTDDDDDDDWDDQLLVWDDEETFLRTTDGDNCLGSKKGKAIAALADKPAKCAGVRQIKVPGEVVCPAGSLLSYVNKASDTGVLTYRCLEGTAMGSCIEWNTPSMSQGDQAFMEATITCNPGMALQAVYVEETGSADSASNSFRYRCCYSASLVMAIVPKGFLGLGLDPFEGAYCPTSRDISGRLLYMQRSSFRATGNPASTLGFDYKLGKWCLDNKYMLRSCIASHVAMPLDDDGLTSPDWQVVAVTDFHGDFKAQGVSTISPTKRVRKKPTLVSFSASRPSVPEECKESVPDWEVAKSLSDDNPCKMVSGKKPPSYSAYNSDKEKYGAAAWWESMSPFFTGKGGAGYSYSNIKKCWSRESK